LIERLVVALLDEVASPEPDFRRGVVWICGLRLVVCIRGFIHLLQFQIGVALETILLAAPLAASGHHEHAEAGKKQQNR